MLEEEDVLEEDGDTEDGVIGSEDETTEFSFDDDYEEEDPDKDH